MALHHQLKGSSGKKERPKEETKAKTSEPLAQAPAASKRAAKVSNSFLREVGEALYGKHWRTEMSHDLRVSRPTLYAWLGQDELNADQLIALTLLIRARRDRLNELLGEGS